MQTVIKMFFIFVLIVGVVIAMALFVKSCSASPLYFTLDSGFTAFKWGYQTTDRVGFPHLESPKWDVEPGFEWSPSVFAKRGVWFRGSFRWQALGHWPRTVSQEFYVDGPRIGLRFRARLLSGD